MDLLYDIDKCINEADNIFDLIANCFDLLCSHITNHALFIGQYIDQSQDSTTNPNIENLNYFSEKIIKILDNYSPSKYADVQKEIIQLINNFDLIDFMDDQKNHDTIIYCILCAIDAAAMEWDRKWLTSSFGPLNKKPNARYKVYFHTHRTIHSDYIDQIGRTRTHPSTFFEQFQSFRFIDSGRWKENINIPYIKYLPGNYIKKKPADTLNPDLKLKIAVIPVSCNKNFDFELVTGSTFRVDYSKNDQTAAAETIIKSIEKALLAQCNIIVLPEYTISPIIHKAIQETIRKHSLKNCNGNTLFAVFEGSTWTDDDNNVMRILDPFGDEIGRYYKYSPYTKLNTTKHGFNYVEGLTTPGKQCDMLALEDLGLFLPAICRDVIDGEYTAEIAKALFPTFIVISAWSASVASFKSKEKEFANKYFTSSIFANSCSSVDINQDTICNGCIVSKENTIAGSYVCNLDRSNCTATCNADPCVFIMEYDFTFESDCNTCIASQKI